MAFVKMTNMLVEIEVPAGAVNAYKSLGYEIVGSVKEPAVESDGSYDDDGEDELSEDDKFVLTIEKKPLQQWNKEEVKQYAAIKGVDITGTKNAQEAKERIKTYMDNAAE